MGNKVLEKIDQGPVRKLLIPGTTRLAFSSSHCQSLNQIKEYVKTLGCMLVNPTQFEEEETQCTCEDVAKLHDGFYLPEPIEAQ